MTGENTLEAQLVRVLTKSIVETGEFSVDDFRNRYITFMQVFENYFCLFYLLNISYLQTPGSHNDTYASTCHRMFFSNLVQGKAPQDCPDNDGHNVDAIDALTLTVPVILKYHSASREVRNDKVSSIVG